MSCDYTDIIMPIDYIPQSFEFANRKLFHKWKMVGMQVSHGTFGGADGVHFNEVYGSNGFLGSGTFADGVASGCRVIEEVNQNNHIIGRGSWYFRAKSNGQPSSNSAAYGIMGHCNTPGIEWGMWDSYSGQDMTPSVFVLEDPLEAAPIRRGWGKAMGQQFCSCAGPGNTSWHMGVFIRDNNLDPDKVNNIFFVYSKDQKYPSIDPNEWDALNSHLPGRFNAWATAEYVQRPYRTCEVNMGAGTDMVRLQGSTTIGKCSILAGKANDNGITDPKNPQSPFGEFKVYGGLGIKLTSLPACNHFDKVFSYPPLLNDFTNRQIGFRCERAVLRIIGRCRITAMGGSASAEKYEEYQILEKHYDRWDRSDDYVGCYKIFDEVFEIEDLNWTVRILSHHKKVLENWADVQEYGSPNAGFWNEGDYIWANAMNKQFLTGGKVTDSPTGAKGCTCSNELYASEHYPIRPYNQYNYCANNFTCEKTC